MSVIINQGVLKKHEGKTGTVLLVEDNEANAEFLIAALTLESPYTVLLMRSGQEALQRLEEIKESQPLLLLLDYLLPTLNGLDLYHQLHAHEELSTVPAIILTAAHLREEVTQTFAQLCVPVLEKPFALDAFFAAIEQAIACISI